MNNNKPNGTKIIVLGGLGEVGKNMYCVMHNDAIVIIDAGVSFPESELMGVDYVLPDFTFLKENEDSWTIENDRIQFKNANRIIEYYNLFNQIVD